MRFRTTLVLFGVLALLSLGYYFLELKEVEKEAKTKLVSFQEEEVSSFSIRRGEKVITLERGENGWRMSEPVEDRADEKEIIALLGNVIRAKTERTLEASGDSLADFGLQNPPIIFTVHLKEKETPFILEVGNTTPAGFSVYARRKGEEKILLAPDTVKTSLEKDAFAFRSKVLLSFAQEAVKAVSLRTDSLHVRLERQEKGKWRITEPVEVAADSGKVSDLLRSLTQDQIQGFPDKPASLKMVGLDPPRGEIRLTLDGGTEATLLLGEREKKEKGGVYARRSGEEQVLVLKETFLKEIPKQVADLRDRTLLAVDREKVDTIELVTPKGRTVLSKAGGTWSMKEPEEASADQRMVNDLLWDLTTTRVKEFVDDDAKTLKPYGLDAPPVTVRLLDPQGKPLSTLTLARASNDEGAYVRVGDSQAVTLVEARLYEQLDKGPFDFRLRQLLSFETWDVGKMELSRNGQEILLEKRKEQWELKKPKQVKAKYSAVIDLLNEIKNLKWQKVVAKGPTDLSPYGLDKPVATFTLTKTDGKSLGTVLLGKSEEDLVYAKLQEKPDIYGIPSAFLESLPQDPSALAE
ncbi:MAG: DUF4340 domain-containing protein [Candidatus Methylomirabilales bacterium]